VEHTTAPQMCSIVCNLLPLAGRPGLTLFRALPAQFVQKTVTLFFSSYMLLHTAQIVINCTDLTKFFNYPESIRNQSFSTLKFFFPQIKRSFSPLGMSDNGIIQFFI
jgi:hypothetical protein